MRCSALRCVKMGNSCCVAAGSQLKHTSFDERCETQLAGVGRDFGTFARSMLPETVQDTPGSCSVRTCRSDGTIILRYSEV